MLCVCGVGGWCSVVRCVGASRRGIVWIACCVRVCECVYVLVSGQVKFRVLLESAISKPMYNTNPLNGSHENATSKRQEPGEEINSKMGLMFSNRWSWYGNLRHLLLIGGLRHVVAQRDTIRRPTIARNKWQSYRTVIARSSYCQLTVIVRRTYCHRTAYVRRTYGESTMTVRRKYGVRWVNVLRTLGERTVIIL